MITYEARFDPTKDNVYAISLVESPAMESMFISLSKEDTQYKVNFAEVDKLEKTLLGVVLVPNRPVYRKQNGQEFYLSFPKDTIKESAHHFFTSGFQLNSTLEHNKDNTIEGISFVESWIVKDPKSDTANAYNLAKEDIVEGAWIVKMKCDNDEIYQKALDGEIKGFSIDGFFNLEQVNLKTEVNMSQKIEQKVDSGFKQLADTLLIALNIKEKPDVKVELGSIKSGEVDIYFDGEMFEIGGAVWLLGDDEIKVALPVGEYPIEGDRTLIVAEEGVVGEIKQGESEETTVEAESEPGASDTAQAEAITQAIKSVLVKYTAVQDAKYDALEVRLKAFEDKNVELEAENIELAKNPAAKKIGLAPAQNKKGLVEYLNNNL